MGVNLHQPSVYALFEAIPTPLLTFAVSGLVTYANAAAKRHPSKLVESMSGNPNIKSWVASATLGKLKMPYAAKIELPDGHHLAGRFMPGPAGLDIAFLADGEGEEGVAIGQRPATMTLKNIIELLRDELGPPMHRLRAELQVQPEAALSLELASQDLVQRLQRLADLIEVFGNDLLDTNDRIEPLALLRSVCGELHARAEKMGVRLDIIEPDQTLPPIYGNLKLLRRAFHECLDNALVHSRKEVTGGQLLVVEIRFTLSGEHVLVSVRNRGASTLKVGSQDVLRPFVAPVSGSADSAPRLGLPLVQRIVGLHGGNMRLGSVDEDTVQVLMEFPTGAPLRGQDTLGISQAQRYAKDLAQLMSRRKKENA